jgi:hypothetical protein
LAHDKPLAGFGALLIGIATLVGPFIYRRKRSVPDGAEPKP